MANIYKFINASSSGGGGGDTEAFSQSFNSGASWGSASGGQYTIAIPESSHEKGQNPTITVYELIGGIYYQVTPDDIIIDASGNIEIKVTENLDTRFEGKIIIK